MGIEMRHTPPHPHTPHTVHLTHTRYTTHTPCIHTPCTTPALTLSTLCTTHTCPPHTHTHRGRNPASVDPDCTLSLAVTPHKPLDPLSLGFVLETLVCYPLSCLWHRIHVGAVATWEDALWAGGLLTERRAGLPLRPPLGCPGPCHLPPGRLHQRHL